MWHFLLWKIIALTVLRRKIVLFRSITVLLLMMLMLQIGVLIILLLLLFVSILVFFLKIVHYTVVGSIYNKTRLLDWKLNWCLQIAASYTFMPPIAWTTTIENHLLISCSCFIQIVIVKLIIFLYFCSWRKSYLMTIVIVIFAIFSKIMSFITCFSRILS